jgi:hypothetical protein
MRVMDGSEPGEITPAAVLSGAPTDLQARTVRFVFIAELSRLRTRLIIFATVFTNPPKRLHNLATGTATTGGWTGMSSTKVTDGRTL